MAAFIRREQKNQSGGAIFASSPSGASDVCATPLMALTDADVGSGPAGGLGRGVSRAVSQHHGRGLLGCRSDLRPGLPSSYLMLTL